MKKKETKCELCNETKYLFKQKKAHMNVTSS